MKSADDGFTDALPGYRMSLPNIIAAEIAASGPMPFRRFMELALYHPQYGYYASGRATIGCRGDYITSVSAGSLFGRLLTDQFEEMWRLLGRPAEFTIVEQGANTGDFAHDVLAAARAFPGFRDALRYAIVEPFPANTERQRERVAQACRLYRERPLTGGTPVAPDAVPDVCRWYGSLSELPRFTGVHFSNELLDAMPVHLVVCRGGQAMERYVSLAEPERALADAAQPGIAFAWEERPISMPALKEAARRLPSVEGYQTEINLAAHDWMAAVAGRMDRGYILVADYGFLQEDFFHPDRIEGTLSCYRGQRRSDDPLVAAGDQDITAHVEFTSLMETAARCGLELLGFTDQHHFMIGLGKHAFPDATGPLSPERQRDLRAFSTLMHPTLLGRGFQFLALGLDAPAQLRGFEFGKR